MMVAICALLMLLSAPAVFAQTYDVVVVGATSAGTGAAIAAGRKGLNVALIEETSTLGGMLSNGLSNTDLDSPGGSSGLFEEFRLRCLKYYTTNFPNDETMRTDPMAKLGFRYEPHVADSIFKQMVAESPTIHVFYKRYVTRVLKDGNRVTGIVTQDVHGNDEKTFHAAITIDATPAGDLLPLAGAKFRIGREPRSSEEPHAGQIYFTKDGEIFGSGKGDDKIQGYAELAIIKDYGQGADKTITRPPGYDPRDYAPEPKASTFWFRDGKLPNHKYEVNEFLSGTDVTGINQGYVTGDRAERKKIAEEYRNHTLGYIYFIQTVMGWKNMGLADDEFVDNGNLPYRLYVREGRRLDGVETFTERDTLKVPTFARPPLHKDSIAVGDWGIDSHAVSRDTEGYIYFLKADRFHTAAPNQAPYGILVPKVVDGLLVPMAVSATHIGFQPLRLEAIRMAMGQAAGDAAVLCVKQKIQPRQVNVPRLQRMLLDQGQSLYYYKDVIPSTPYFKAIEDISVAGIVHGYDDYTFRPQQVASHSDVAKELFNVLNLPVKMDYTDLWKVMKWKADTPAFQYCTPAQWGTYYLMTLYNMGAFNTEFLTNMDPNGPSNWNELIAWTKVALQGKKNKTVPTFRATGPLTRGELAEFIDELRSGSSS